MGRHRNSRLDGSSGEQDSDAMWFGFTRDGGRMVIALWMGVLSAGCGNTSAAEPTAAEGGSRGRAGRGGQGALDTGGTSGSGGTAASTAHAGASSSGGSGQA